MFLKKNPVLVILVLSLFLMSASPTVYFIGDSTMADYDPAIYPNQRGWGQMFRNFLTGDISLVNAARNGRSTRSFYTGSDSLWAGVRTKLKTGDYVFIQFAHNDEKMNGISDTVATGGIATAPWGDYQIYLRKFITETRKSGAIPVLVTPIVRCYFSGSTITAKGKHNLGTDDSTLNYVRAMKAVARELMVPLIDHTTLTCNLAESLGATNAYSTIYVTSDQTHLNPTGGMLYAQLAVQDLIRQKILTNFLNASPNLIITPADLNFGNSYVSTFNTQKISVSGLSLSPENGNIRISTPAGFKAGLSSTGSFSSSIDIPYSGGNLSATDCYIRFEPLNEKFYSDSLIVSYGVNSFKKISVKGNGLNMSSGIAAQIYFPLTANSTPSITGPVLSAEESWTGTYVKNYANITTWPTGISGVNVQRNSISASSNNTTDTWPSGEIDINSERYIQFALKANEGTKVTVDSVGLYAGAAGGSGLKYRVIYSRQADFSNPVTLDDKTSNTSNVMVGLSYKPMAQFNESEGFYLRIYPWYNGTASLKYLCLSGLTIQCKVSPVSKIQPIRNNVIFVYPNPSKGVFYFKNPGNITKISIYDLTGNIIKQQDLAETNVIKIDLSDFRKGIYILKITTSMAIQSEILVVSP